MESLLAKFLASTESQVILVLGIGVVGLCSIIRTLWLKYSSSNEKILEELRQARETIDALSVVLSNLGKRG